MSGVAALAAAACFTWSGGLGSSGAYTRCDMPPAPAAPPPQVVTVAGPERVIERTVERVLPMSCPVETPVKKALPKKPRPKPQC